MYPFPSRLRLRLEPFCVEVLCYFLEGMIISVRIAHLVSLYAAAFSERKIHVKYATPAGGLTTILAYLTFVL